MKNPVIVSAVRTPIGKFLGTLSSIPATDLGAIAVKEAVQRSGVAPDQAARTRRGRPPWGRVFPIRSRP
jgi:acetyl-CoA C-acetyltransferase